MRRNLLLLAFVLLVFAAEGRAVAPPPAMTPSSGWYLAHLDADLADAFQVGTPFPILLCRVDVTVNTTTSAFYRATCAPSDLLLGSEGIYEDRTAYPRQVGLSGSSSLGENGEAEIVGNGAAFDYVKSSEAVGTQICERWAYSTMAGTFTIPSGYTLPTATLLRPLMQSAYTGFVLNIRLDFGAWGAALHPTTFIMLTAPMEVTDASRLITETSSATVLCPEPPAIVTPLPETPEEGGVLPIGR